MVACWEGKDAVVAMGKLGGREMTAASDLDLITVYDFAGEGAHLPVQKSLPGSQYIRASPKG